MENRYVISQPFAATLNGQDVDDTGDPEGYPDASSYMTVDFGFFSSESNAVNLKAFGAEQPLSTNLLIIFALTALAMAGTAAFVWQKR